MERSSFWCGAGPSYVVSNPDEFNWFQGHTEHHEREDFRPPDFINNAPPPSISADHSFFLPPQTSNAFLPENVVPPEVTLPPISSFFMNNSADAPNYVVSNPDEFNCFQGHTEHHEREDFRPPDFINNAPPPLINADHSHLLLPQTSNAFLPENVVPPEAPLPPISSFFMSSSADAPNYVVSNPDEFNCFQGHTEYHEREDFRPPDFINNAPPPLINADHSHLLLPQTSNAFLPENVVPPEAPLPPLSSFFMSSSIGSTAAPPPEEDMGANISRIEIEKPRIISTKLPPHQEKYRDCIPTAVIRNVTEAIHKIEEEFEVPQRIAFKIHEYFNNKIMLIRNNKELDIKLKKKMINIILKRDTIEENKFIKNKSLPLRSLNPARDVIKEDFFPKKKFLDVNDYIISKILECFNNGRRISNVDLSKETNISKVIIQKLHDNMRTLYDAELLNNNITMIDCIKNYRYNRMKLSNTKVAEKFGMELHEIAETQTAWSANPSMYPYPYAFSSQAGPPFYELATHPAYEI